MDNQPRDSGLFTVVMEFDGTTSISQFVAARVGDALKLWLIRLQEPNAYGLSRSLARSLHTAFVKHPSTAPVRIEGVANVWCTTAFVGRKFALLNIVKTCRR